jgi:hypothetical protein
MRSRLAEILQGTVVVVAVALVAASLPHLEGKSVEVQLLFALIGGVASAVVLLAVRAVRSDGRLRGSSYVEPSKYRGLKIGFVGFCVAVLGWLVAVFIAGTLGFWLVVLGVAIGFVGMIVHFVMMFAPTEKGDA